MDMRIAIFGNSGSGKSTLARDYAERYGLACLELDAIVWEPGQVAVVRARADIDADVDAFVASHRNWVVEGCYGELVERVMPLCTEVIFLNPGLETCLAHNRRRPWEPHKYDSAEAQDAMLEPLLAWVEAYYSRDDQWSLAYHRRIFDAYEGTKTEMCTAPSQV